MAKLNILFPTGISFGAVGGPAFSTEVTIVGSGFESRNQNWAQARCMWDVSRACRSAALAEELIAFFRIAKGRANSFRFRDFTDYTVATGQGIVSSLGIGAGSPTGMPAYQLYKEYTNAVGSDAHKIVFPTDVVLKAGAATLQVGVHYSLDELTGIATMIGSPTQTPTSWTGGFDRHARFDTDRLQLQVEEINTFFRSQPIMIVEVRD